MCSEKTIAVVTAGALLKAGESRTRIKGKRARVGGTGRAVWGTQGWAGWELQGRTEGHWQSVLYLI